MVAEQPHIDGNTTGCNVMGSKFLNETSEITADVIFTDLTVLGNITFQKIFFNKRPLNFGDLLLKTDVNAKITGTKTFHGDVVMKSNLTITSGLINGHSMDEFVTTDTEQEFPNLKNVTSLITFGNITYKFAERLENLLNKTGNDGCLEKIILFRSPIVVDYLSFDTVNNNVSFAEFSRKLNESFENIIFDRLDTGTLIAEEIAPKEINGVDYDSFAERVTSSINVTDYTIENLECDYLDAKTINGMSISEINDLMNRFTVYVNDLVNGKKSLDSLQVTGKINVNLINGVDLSKLYGERRNNVIFKNNVTVEKLTIVGLLNGLNFTEHVMDTVLKTDSNITVDGHKTFSTVYCRELETISLNDHPLENIFDPAKDQLITGPVIVNGSVTVLEKFHATGSIGNIKFEDLVNRRKSLGNNSYEFHENVNFPNNVTIKNLVVNGSIQGRDFDAFLKTVIFKNENNVVITGAKVFENLVTFNDEFYVHDKLNDIDLNSFWNNAVFIDKPFFIKSKIIFENDIQVENDLIVKTDLAVGSVMGIDVNELKLGVLYRNRPLYIEETIELTDVVFRSNIEVERFNGLDMRLLISLKKEQTIPVERLSCQNVTADKFEYLGRINGVNLTTVQDTTFMKFGSQNITGHFNFTGQVRIRRQFNARLINGIDPTRTIPLNSNSTLKGNFIFEKPVILNQSLRVLSGYLNDIDLSRWEAMAVKTSSFLPQIVSGKWTVNGNVYFENGATGSNVLNGTNLDELADTLGKRYSEMDAWATDANATLEDMCRDLTDLAQLARKQIYRFSVFDFLQIIEFDDRIVSLHQFELDGLDYLIISYDTCRMQTYQFNGGKFESVANVADFGFVHGWITFKDNESLYFLTSGIPICGRNSTNLWKLEDNEFKHVLSLGRKIDSRKVDQNVLLKIISRKNEKRSSKIDKKELEEALSALAGDNDMKIVLPDDQLLLTNSQRANKYDIDKMKESEVLKFKAGIFEKEISLYYNEDVSVDHIFIWNYHGARQEVLQTIRAYKPTSFTVLNFEGNIETLLLFIENKRVLQIYEYKGIQGFVHRDSIRLNIDKLFNFKIRRTAGLAKRHCLALIHGNRLTILEAKMYGEKVDMESLKCSRT
ncbi:female sterile (1) Nasrat [Augochlora pura]